MTAVNTDAPFAPSFSYQYNAVNNRVGAIESGGSNVSFANDAISQLVSEIRTGTNPYSISYSFDALGNRVSENNGGVTTTRTFNAANSMLTAVPSVGASTSRTYDACGNLTLSNTGGALTTLVCDSENRLTSCTQPSLAETYSYQASLKRMFMKSNFYRASLAGVRASKTSGGSTEHEVVAASCSSNHAHPGMIWSDQNLAIATDAGFNLVERQSDAPGDWGDLTYQEQDGYFVIPMFDAQGSNRFSFWFQGTSFWQNLMNFDAFGNMVSTPPAQPEPMQYVGQYGYYTDATGFVYEQAGYYDPVNGIPISPTSAGSRGRCKAVNMGDKDSDRNLLNGCLSRPTRNMCFWCAYEKLKGQRVEGGCGGKPISDEERRDQANAICKTHNWIARDYPGSNTASYINAVCDFSGCYLCARAIKARYFNNNDTHLNNPGYAHCVSCCWMTRSAMDGGSCAFSMQKTKITITEQMNNI